MHVLSPLLILCCVDSFLFDESATAAYWHGCVILLFAAKMPHILFTGLEDYKARGTQAAPYFTVTYYKEFAETKGVVLIRGDIVFTSQLSDSDARWLLETIHSFYMNDTRYKLVERFNRETRDFEFKDVLSSLEMSVGWSCNIGMIIQIPSG